MVEEENKIGQSLLHPVVFQKRKYQVFSSTFGTCLLQLPNKLHHDDVRMLSFKYYQYYSGYKMQSLFKLINKGTRTTDCRLAGVFSKNLENLSHPILM